MAHPDKECLSSAIRNVTIRNIKLTQYSVVKVTPAAPPPAAAKADVVRLGVARVSFLQKKVIPALPGIAARTIPPLVGLALTLIVWELLCSDPGASLPAPSQIWRDAKELILDERHHMVLLDELNIVLRYDYLPVDEVVAFLRDRKPPGKHVVITGRNAERGASVKAALEAGGETVYEVGRMVAREGEPVTIANLERAWRD